MSLTRLSHGARQARALRLRAARAPSPRAPTRPAPDFATALRHVLREHHIVVTLAALYVGGAAVVLALRAPGGTLIQAVSALPSVILGNCATVATIASFWILGFVAQHRPAHPFSAISRAFGNSPVRTTMIARALVIVPLLSLVMVTFCAIKLRIPLLHPFAFDTRLAELDALLHGGVQPWAILHPVLGIPIVTALLDRLYYLWFPVVFLTFYWQALAVRRDALRLQFVIAFAASWILTGSIAAIALSSGGPAFLADLGFNAAPFDGLFAFLRDVDQTQRPLMALQVQDMLWHAFLVGASAGVEGISAMPSMHVSLAVLLALFGWRLHWLAGIAYSVFAVLIFLGSIELGFHYAVDGYVGALMAAAIWLVSGWIARRERAALANDEACFA